MTDRDLKAAEIDFPECSLVDDGIGLEAEVLGAVAGKMLQRGADTFGLYAVDIVRCQRAGQERVFRIVFEVSAAERRTFDADAGAQQDGQTFRTALIAQLFAEGSGALFVPCAGNGCRGREADGFDGSEAVHLPQAGGAVGHHDGRDRQPVDRGGVPEVFPGKKADLLTQCHLFYAQFKFHFDSSYYFSGEFYIYT